MIASALRAAGSCAGMRACGIMLPVIFAGCFPPPHFKDAVDTDGHYRPDGEDESGTSATTTCETDGGICACTIGEHCVHLDLCNGM